MVEGRMLDDDGAVLLRFNEGAAGVLMASQVAAGEENALKIRVYGEKGGLEWAQQEPNTLLVKWLDKPTEILRAGGGYPHLSRYATPNCPHPGGHPEGYLEAFGNLYRNFALTLTAKIDGATPAPEALDFPSVNEGYPRHGIHRYGGEIFRQYRKMDEIRDLTGRFVRFNGYWTTG